MFTMDVSESPITASTNDAAPKDDKTLSRRQFAARLAKSAILPAVVVAIVGGPGTARAE
jgi:predicted Rossmann-fold nucleotide-binding protein